MKIAIISGESTARPESEKTASENETSLPKQSSSFLLNAWSNIQEDETSPSKIKFKMSSSPENIQNDETPPPIIYRDRNNFIMYRCSHPECDRAFTRPYNLKAHYLSNHTTLRPFSCPDCSLTFVRKNDLKRHERLHSKVRPFSCDKCSYTASRGDALKRHKVSHLPRYWTPEMSSGIDSDIVVSALSILKRV